MNPTFDIDALRAVVAGIELRSFARAAVQLGRSQSAISMQLKKLEQQAGTRLFVREGRGLVPTDAGEVLAAYARRIVALNDEAAHALGAAATTATVRLGLPQDFFDDVMPATLQAFARRHADVHVEVRAGPNYGLGDEIRSGRLDGAIMFYPDGSGGAGELLCKLPVYWLARRGYRGPAAERRVPLVLFDHHCLFRQAALTALDRARRQWQVAVTTPSLPGIWAALRSDLGFAVRTEHGLPEDIARVGKDFGLPKLPTVELRMLRAKDASPVALDLCETLQEETIRKLAPA